MQNKVHYYCYMVIPIVDRLENDNKTPIHTIQLHSIPLKTLANHPAAPFSIYSTILESATLHNTVLNASYLELSRAPNVYFLTI